MSNKNKTIEDSRIGLKKFELLYSFLGKLVEAVKWMAVAYFASNSINSLAGKVTWADLNINTFFGDSCTESPVGWLMLIVVFSLVIAVISILYGRFEARLRKNTVEKLDSKIKTLEQIIDPKRTSSLLTERGETPKGDK